MPAGGRGTAGAEEIEGHFMQPLTAMDFMQARVIVEGRRTIGAEVNNRRAVRRLADAMPSVVCLMLLGLQSRIGDEVLIL